MTTLVMLFSSISATYNLPPNLLSSVCYVETRHIPTAVHFNDGGSDSYGICQIKYLSAKDVGFSGSKEELLDPQVNITIAALILKKHLKKYDYDIARAVTAYNRGKSTGDGNSNYYRKVYAIWRKYEQTKTCYASNW